MFVSYIELHCHSAFSFLDGASLPEELVAAAVERGHTALALTDHDTVCGLDGVRAGGAAARAAGDPRGGGHGPRPRRHAARRRPPPDAAGARRARLVEPLPAAHARGRAHARDRRAALARRAVGARSTTSRSTPRGSSASAAARARACATSRRCAGCCAAFGRDAFRVELQRPFPRHDRALNRGLAALAARLGVPCVATGNVHAHTPDARAAAGRVRRRPRAHDARRLRAAAPRQPRARARHAGGDGRALRGPSGRGRGDRARWPTR